MVKYSPTWKKYPKRPCFKNSSMWITIVCAVISTLSRLNLCPSQSSWTSMKASSPCLPVAALCLCFWAITLTFVGSIGLWNVFDFDRIQSHTWTLPTYLYRLFFTIWATSIRRMVFRHSTKESMVAHPSWAKKIASYTVHFSQADC